VVRTGDDVRADELADALGRLGAGVDRRLDAADVAFDHDGDKAAADLYLANDGDVRRFDHGVAGFDAADIATGFYHTDGITHDVLLLGGLWVVMDHLRSSTGVSGCSAQALPSSVSMWTSSLKSGCTRANRRSNVVAQGPP